MKAAKLLSILAISAVLIGCGGGGEDGGGKDEKGSEPLQRGTSVVFEFHLPSDDVKELQARLDEINALIAIQPTRPKSRPSANRSSGSRPISNWPERLQNPRVHWPGR